MENNLNKWFDAARHNPPMISIKEVGAMISKTPAVKGGFSTLTKFIFMGTVILTIVGWLYWMNINTPVEHTIQNKENDPATTPVLEVQEQELIQEHFTKRPMDIAADDSERAMPFEIDIEKNIHDIIKEQSLLSYYPVGSIMSVNNPTIISFDGIELTHEELARLGIITDGNMLEYKNINGALTSSDTIHSIFHLHVEEHGSRRTNQGIPDADGKVKRFSKPFWPAAIQIISNRDTDLMVVETMNKDWEHPFFVEAKEFLIPVLTSTIAKPGRYSHDLQLIFWFKPEPAFFEVLPAGISTALKKEYSVSSLEKYKLVYNQYADRIKGIERVKGFDSVRVALLKREYVNLNKSDLKKLNIKKLSDGIRYENRFYENGKINEIKFSRRGYYTSVNVNNKMFLIKRIRKRDKPFTAVAVTSPDFTRITYLYVYPDSIGYTKQHHMNESSFNKDAENMIPIQADDQTVFWFPKTEELMKVFNERIQYQLRMNVAAFNHRLATPVKYIELTDEQLAKLGITRNAESITVPMHTGEGKYLFSDYSSKGTMFHFNLGTFSNEPLKAPPSGIKFNMSQGGSEGMKQQELKPFALAYPSPSLITDGNGLHWLTYETGEDITKEEREYLMQNSLSPLEYKPMVEARKRGEEKLAAALNTYVALKVKSNEKTSDESKRNPDLIIWYKPDSLFLATLPAELSSQIKQELERISLKQAPSACKFFEACESVKGSIGECVVYPNPASFTFQIRMELTEQRCVSIFLTDISGKKVKELLPNEAQPKGVFTKQLALDGLPDGMYLLHINTDKGEYIVQRLIKKE